MTKCDSSLFLLERALPKTRQNILFVCKSRVCFLNDGVIKEKKNKVWFISSGTCRGSISFSLLSKTDNVVALFDFTSYIKNFEKLDILVYTAHANKVYFDWLFCKRVPQFDILKIMTSNRIADELWAGCSGLWCYFGRTFRIFLDVYGLRAGYSHVREFSRH